MSACDWWDMGCGLNNLGQLLGGTVSDAVAQTGNNVIAGIAAGALAGWVQLQQLFMVSWLATPELTDPSNPTGSVSWLQGLLSNLTVSLAVIGCLITAIYTLLSFRGDRARELGISMVRLLVVTLAGTTIFVALDHGIHVGSLWIITQAGVTAQSGLFQGALAQISPFVYFIIGSIGVFGVLLQWGVMLVRNAVLPLLLAVWPLSAAAAALGKKGAESFDRITAWMVAFLIYPLAAAIVYAFAFRLQNGNDGIGGAINGMILQVLALLAMPALFRIIAPATKALGKSWGGAMAVKAAITAVETAVAVGATVATAGAAGAAFGAAGAARTAGTAAKTAGPQSAPSATGAPTTPAPATPSPQPASEAAGSPPPAQGARAPTAGSSADGARPAAAPQAEPAPQSAPTGATTPPAPAPAAPPPGGARHASSGSDRRYAAAQAARDVSQNASRSAHGALDDLDDTLGGHA